MSFFKWFCRLFLFCFIITINAIEHLPFKIVWPKSICPMPYSIQKYLFSVNHFHFITNKPTYSWANNLAFNLDNLPLLYMICQPLLVFIDQHFVFSAFQTIIKIVKIWHFYTFIPMLNTWKTNNISFFRKVWIKKSTSLQNCCPDLCFCA